MPTAFEANHSVTEPRDVSPPTAPTATALVSAAEVHANPAPPEVQATAHRAVESVLMAAEMFGEGNRRSVQLQFTVGGADLAIRVELHAGEVRATFSTDSSELRSALAQEWQTVSCEAPNRTLQLASPVFASGDASLNPGFSGDTTPQHRDPRAAQELAAFVFSPSIDHEQRSTSTVDGHAPVRMAPLSNAVHLEAFA